MTSPLARIILFSFLFLLFIPDLTYAETKTFIKEYTYQASEDDSRNSSRTLALREVKRLLLEELGTYLESITEIKNFQLTKDRITALTAGIVQTEIMADKWDGDSLKYWLKAKIVADSNEVIKSIDALRNDRSKTKDLEELRRRSDALLKDNERLRKELMVSSGENKQKAVIAYNKTITDINAIDWLEKGNVLGKAWKWQDAREAFTKAIELDPEYAQAYRDRGTSYHVFGDNQQAIIDYDRAIELDPKFDSAYYMRGLAKQKLKQYRQAIKDFDMAIILNSKFAPAYGERGDTYISLGDYQQGFKDIDKAIELEPNPWGSYYKRAAAYEKLGNHKQAIMDYDRTIELAPSFDEAYYARGAVHLGLGDHRRAMQDFDKVIKLNPKREGIYYGRGYAFFSLGEYQQAIKDFDMAIEIDPKHAWAYHVRGLTNDALGNYNMAIQDLRIAARLGLKEAQDYLRKKGIDW